MHRRAWLPPSVAWLFAPRDNAYDVGGWYFELPEDAAGLPALEVHPHIMVLLAGLRYVMLLCWALENIKNTTKERGQMCAGDVLLLCAAA